MRRIIDDVAKYDWHVVAVRPDKSSLLSFSFTVGLFKTFDHPELVLFGLPDDAAHGLFSACVERVKQGAVFADGQVRTDLLTHHSIAVFSIDPSFYEEFLGSAIGYYDTLEFPALQLVWPDKANRFPWDSNFDSACEGLQKLLNSAVV